jgi:hypothetical protein
MTDTFLEFDPNLPTGHQWATYIDGWQRNSAFKTHSKRGHAIGRVTTNRRCKLYSWKPEGGWKLEFVKDQERMPRQCDSCHQDMDVDKQPPTYSMHYRATTADGVKLAAAQYVAKEKGKTALPLRIVTLCHPCATGMGYR